MVLELLILSINNIRSKEYAEKENLKNIYARNIAPSIAFDTENF